MRWKPGHGWRWWRQRQLIRTGVAVDDPHPRSQDAEIIAEYNDRMIQCFKDEGIAVTRGDIGWQLGQPGDDPEIAKAVIKRCTDRVGVPPIQPPTADEASQLFDLMTETSACLQEHGYTVSPAPSREEGVDTFLAGGAYWSPYNHLDISAADAAACPEPSLSDLE